MASEVWGIETGPVDEAGDNGLCRHMELSEDLVIGLPRITLKREELYDAMIG